MAQNTTALPEQEKSAGNKPRATSYVTYEKALESTYRLEALSLRDVGTSPFPVFHAASSRASQKTKMKNDIYQTFGETYNNIPAQLTYDIIEISKHTVSQESMQAWANNLRFLTAAPPTSVDPEPVTVGEAASCSCKHWKPFSSNTEYDKLYLTEYGQLQNCRHYVAVSYCWQQQSDTSKANNEPYKVSTAKGIRAGRAPKDVVRRAIQFAASKGVSFIWVDQECIEQDDREDKELGVQSMDLVYLRSHYPLGLLEVIMETQAQFDFMVQAIGRRNRPGDKEGYGQRLDTFYENQEPVTEEELDNVALVLELLATDKWLSRAWILQETILSGNHMTFMLRCNPAVVVKSPLNTVMGEITLNILDMKGLDGSEMVYVALESGIIDNIQGGDVLLERLRRAAKAVTPRLTVGWRLWDGYSHANNVIGASTLLETYTNSRIPDRLAIIANLCNYRVRLNTNVVDELGFSFSVCLFTLALINGDFSFLRVWHELSYGVEFPAFVFHRKPLPRLGNLLNSDHEWDTFSWAPSPLARIASPDKYSYEGDLHMKSILFSEPAMRLSGAEIRSAGLHFKGWLWAIQESVDLDHLAQPYADSFFDAVDNAESLKETIMSWDLGVHFVWFFFMALIELKLHDLAELIWSQGIIDHIQSDFPLSQDAEGNERTTFNQTSLEFEGGRPVLVDFLHHDSASYIGDESCWNVSQEDFGRILERVVKRKFDSEWDWLIPQIIVSGKLQYWKLDGDFNANSKAIGVFDSAGSPNILTPSLSSDMSKDKMRLFLQVSRKRPNSWAVSKEGEDAEGSVLCRGNGMTRGMFKTYGAKIQGFTMS